MTTNFHPQRPDCWDYLCQRLGIRVALVPIASKSKVQIAPSEWFTPKGDGDRTAHLVSMAGQLLASGCGLDAVTAACLAWNATNTLRLEDSKIIETCQSLEQTDRRQHPDRARRRDALSLVFTPLFDIADARIDKYLSVAPPPMRWVLKDLLPLGISAGIAAPGGVGKSQFLMQLAYSVASGIPLAGMWAVGEVGSVLMLCAEDDADAIHRRVQKIHQQIGTAQTPTQLTSLKDRLYVRSTIGDETLMTAKDEWGEVTRTSWPERLVMTIQAITDIKLIIIDPASRFRGGEENSNEDGTRFVQALEYVARQTGSTILIAHHSNKSALNATDGAHQGHARGASSLVDGLRWMLALTTVGKTHPQHRPLNQAQVGHYVEASLVKSNYTAPQEPVYLRRELDGYLTAFGAGISPTGPEPQLLMLLSLLSGTANLTAKDVELRHCGQGKAIQIAQKRVRELIKAARDSGLITGHGRQPLKLTPQGQAITPASTPKARRGAGKIGAA